MASMIIRVEDSGSEVIGTTDRESSLPFKSTTATIACVG
jgi:hypothetical protein